MWKNEVKAALTLSFDDGYKETYDITVDLLSRFGLKATYNIPTGYVGRQLEGLAVASWEDWQRAASNGMEIASHSVNHKGIQLSLWENASRFIKSYYRERQKASYLRHTLKEIVFSSQLVANLTNEHTLITEAMDSKDKIHARIFGCEVSSYTYPYGVYNSCYKRVVESIGYSSARSLDRGCNQAGSTDFFALKSMLWNQYMTLEVANKWVDYTIKKGAWLIETIHLVGDKPLADHYPDYICVGDFEKHIDYIMSKDIWVDTQQNVVQYMREREGVK